MMIKHISYVGKRCVNAIFILKYTFKYRVARKKIIRLQNVIFFIIGGFSEKLISSKISERTGYVDIVSCILYQ